MLIFCYFYYGLSHHCIQELVTFCSQPTEFCKSLLFSEGIGSAATVFNVIVESELKGNFLFKSLLHLLPFLFFLFFGE